MRQAILPALTFLLLISAVQAQSADLVPVSLLRISSDFGIRKDPITGKSQHHSGVDIAATEGAEVRTIGAGIVAFAGEYAHYGKLVTVLHGKRTASLYGHLKDIKVAIGTLVSDGEAIGTVGSTGRVTGPHLHFEVRKDGNPTNPTEILKSLNAKINIDRSNSEQRR